MRGLVIFIIACLMFAGVTNAAASCCISVEPTPSEQTAEPPCHGADQSEASTTVQPLHDCECEGCTQLNLTSAAIDSAALFSAADTLYARNFNAPDLADIYYPPKHNS